MTVIKVYVPGEKHPVAIRHTNTARKTAATPTQTLSNADKDPKPTKLMASKNKFTLGDRVSSGPLQGHVVHLSADGPNQFIEVALDTGELLSFERADTWKKTSCNHQSRFITRFFRKKR